MKTRPFALVALALATTACSTALAAEPSTTTVAATTTTTSTTTTSTTSTTTTTTTPPDTTIAHRTYPVDEACPQWEQTAVNVGWPVEQVDKLSHIMWRESRCHPDSWNHSDPMGGSMGLVQLNRFWCLPTTYHPEGWLEENGVVDRCEDLLNPRYTLVAALAVWKHSGWAPWGG